MHSGDPSTPEPAARTMAEELGDSAALEPLDFSRNGFKTAGASLFEAGFAGKMPRSQTLAAGCKTTSKIVAGEQAENTMGSESISVRIAVAEDEPDIRKTFVRLLELLGHQVVYSVGNGAELLDQSLDGSVDVVFVDLDMPVMDGLAAAEEVERKGIPVILVSGHPDSERVVLDHEPVVARITKPASIESVQQAICAAVAGRHLPPR